MSTPSNPEFDYTVQIYPDRRPWTRTRLRFRFVGNNNEKLGGAYYNESDLTKTVKLIALGERHQRIRVQILDRSGKVIGTDYIVREPRS